MIVIIDVQNKNIRVEDKQLSMPTQDFSWIASDITYVRWYGTQGQIQYVANEEGLVHVELIKELGIYAQAIEMFNNEKQRLNDEQKAQSEAQEAARNYWEELRFLRDEKLAECDWTQITDAPLTEEQKTAWRNYRQVLRDLPENITDPKPLVNDRNDPQWPIIPS